MLETEGGGILDAEQLKARRGAIRLASQEVRAATCALMAKAGVAVPDRRRTEVLIKV